MITRILKALFISFRGLATDLLRGFGGLLLIGVFGLGALLGIGYGVMWFVDPDYFDKEAEKEQHLKYYAEQVETILPGLKEGPDKNPEAQFNDKNFVVWHFGDNASFFTTRYSAQYHAKSGKIAGVDDPRYKFKWNDPFYDLEKYYDDEFFLKRAGFAGKPPLPHPDRIVLVKPEEQDSNVYSFPSSDDQTQTENKLIKRFRFKVWLYDLKNKEVLAYKTFLPDPWPDQVSITIRKKRRRTGYVTGQTNHIGSNRALFDWLATIFPPDQNNPYVFNPKRVKPWIEMSEKERLEKGKELEDFVEKGGSKFFEELTKKSEAKPIAP